MRKSSIFISATLTTFALVVLYGVVSAYRGIADTTVASPQITATSTLEATATVAPTQTALSAEQAAQVAAQLLNRKDLLSAESSNVNGTNAYKVIFISGDIVYVGLDGKILSIQIAPHVVTIQAQPAQQTNNNNNTGNGGNNNGGNNNSGGEHESGD